MMATRKILLISCALSLTFFKGQLTEDSIKAVNDLYEQYYTSDVLAMSPANKWAVISDKNSYGLERAHLVQLENGRSEAVPLSYKTFFFNEDLLISQLADRTVVKSLKGGEEIVLTGSYQYEAFEAEEKFLFYDRMKKELFLFDRTGKKLRSYQEIESLGKSYRKASIIFRSSAQTFRLDLKTLQLDQWKSEGKVLWQGIRERGVVSLESDGRQYQIRHYSKGNDVKSEKLFIDSGFYLDSLSIVKMALKQNRYLILPLLRKTEKAKAQQAEILYTNQNSTYRRPMDQMAVYDLIDHQWKRMPEDSDLYSVQVLLDDFGTVMSYDPSLDIIENESNVNHQMKIQRNYGESKTKIDNTYERKQNYYYDSLTKRMIYFREQKWWVENTGNGVVNEIPFEKPSDFIGWTYSGLSDHTSGNAYPTNHYGLWIISDGYDLFLVDVVKVSVKQLTNGREKGISYSIPENFRTKYLKDSYWDTSKPQSISLEKKLILKAFNTSNYTSGIAELNLKDLKLKTLVTLNDVVQEVFVSDGAITFTAYSYDQPLSIYSLHKNNELKHLYHSKGKEGATPPLLRKEMIRYKVKDQWHNAVLLYPLNYRKGEKYPVVFNVYEKKSKDVTVHMLPTLYNNTGFNPMHYVFQDYFVLLPDLAYEKEAVGHSISQSIEELVNVIAQNKAIDLEKMALTGVSFGGYESFYLMANGKWFKTGFSGVGIADLPSNAMSFTKSIGVPNYFKDERQQARMLKSLFDNYSGYLDNSPLYHLKTMKQPMLIWLGKNDGNVNPDQSRMFFLGMKRLGKKGVLLEYPNEGHNLNQKDNQLDLNVKGWEWMEYQLKGKTAADWIKPLLD